MTDGQGVAPPPGFYDDGSGRQRWWDGDQWTEHRQGAPAPVESQEDESISGSAIVGYVLAFVMPFIGFLVGLALIARKDRHGVGVVLLSIIVFLLFIYLVAS